VVDDVGPGIVGTGDRELDVRDALAVDVGGRARVGDDVVDGRDRVGGGEVDRRLEPTAQVAGEVADGRGDGGRSGVAAVAHRHGDRVGRVGIDGVDLGVGSWAAALVADDGHQARLGEPLERLGDGRLGQAGQLPQLRPCQAPAIEDVAERRRLVHRP
jgi:hypothetical protein